MTPDLQLQSHLDCPRCRNKSTVIQTVPEKPTLDSPCGRYKWCPPDGMYGGFWYVGHAWTGAKFVAAADSEGVPW